MMKANAIMKSLPHSLSWSITYPILVGAAYVFLYWHVMADLASDWSCDPNFSHGFIIPLVFLYMIRHKKHTLEAIDKQPSNWGFLILGMGMVVYIVGYLGAELFFMRISMIITLTGIIAVYAGFRVLTILALPLAYLLLMIPVPAIIWNQIAFPLQLFAAKMASHTIALAGIPVFREGNILHLANTSLEVIDACSGIRSLTSLIALTWLFAFIAEFSLWKKWILFLSAIPIAVMVNVIRLTITGMMAAWIGPESAHGFLHDMSGMIIFISALILVFFVFFILQKCKG